MGGLITTGKILSLIGGVLAILQGVLYLVDITIGALDVLNIVKSPFGGFNPFFVGFLYIILGQILVFVFTGRFEVKNSIVLGIIVIIVAYFCGSLIAMIGGFLIFLEAIL